MNLLFAQRMMAPGALACYDGVLPSMVKALQRRGRRINNGGRERGSGGVVNGG